MSVPRSRLLDLMKAQCQIFATTYNPDGVRMGTKVLRQRLKGPSMLAYYPRRVPKVSDMARDMRPHLELMEDEEFYRLDKIEELKARGKSAPKKKTEAKAKPGRK